jgi:hypothetical protein
MDKNLETHTPTMKKVIAPYPRTLSWNFVEFGDGLVFVLFASKITCRFNPVTIFSDRTAGQQKK